MSFWYKERQKIALWWNGISRQEIHSYVYTAVLFLFLTFLYFISIHSFPFPKHQGALSSQCERALFQHKTQSLSVLRLCSIRNACAPRCAVLALLPPAHRRCHTP